MIVRRLAARRLVKKGSTEEEPKRKRATRRVDEAAGHLGRLQRRQQCLLEQR
jgi:hypothetical protein